MLPEGSVAARRIWKRFRADRPHRSLRSQARHLGRRIRHRESRGWTWALRDVDLVAEPGESVGLVGRNGSGKSTLLKILTRVMYPYAGSVDAVGRVGALIAVRAGINPELTGRENIYLNGALLGLRRRQVAERFDEIVHFAQLDAAIDRQVKFFSSGMYMRLGFGVAAFLEPDVLLVDEVLAVGDAAFQQRCLDRIRTVLAQGTTLVFVSHDLAAVESTCARGLWLDDGVVQADGPVREVLNAYRSRIEESAELAYQRELSGLLRLVKAEVTGAGGERVLTGEPLEIRLAIESPDALPGNVCIGVSDGTPSPMFLLRRGASFVAGNTEVRCTIAHLPLPRGRYFIWLGVFDVRRGRDLLPWHPAAHFDVQGPDLERPPPGVVRLAPIYVESDWTVERV